MEMKAPNTTTQPQPPSGGLEREAEAMSARKGSEASESEGKGREKG